MYDEKKVARVKQLEREIRERVEEMNAIFGGGSSKKTWSRKPKTEEDQAEIKPGI
jgi:hypothetical protein